MDKTNLYTALYSTLLMNGLTTPKLWAEAREVMKDQSEKYRGEALPARYIAIDPGNTVYAFVDKPVIRIKTSTRDWYPPVEPGGTSGAVGRYARLLMATGYLRKSIRDLRKHGIKLTQVPSPHIDGPAYSEFKYFRALIDIDKEEMLRHLIGRLTGFHSSAVSREWWKQSRLKELIST